MIIEYNGSSDLGGGMKSLYNLKLLNADGTGAAGTFKVDQYFLGVAAPFGTVWAGKVAGVTDANVPGGSLDSVAGSGDYGLTGSKEGQLRYESPRINGLKLGISGVLNGANGATPHYQKQPNGTDITDDSSKPKINVVSEGSDNPAGSLDEMNIMAHYELPIGLVMALGYETKDRGVTPALGQTQAAYTMVSDKSSGFRFGATYSQDNWTVAYNYRKYNEHNGFASEKLNVAGTPYLDRRNSSTEYQGHRMAAKFVVDRVTMSANYSTETVSTDIPANVGAVRSAEVSRTTLGVDAKYTLGAKSFMALGHQNQDTEAYEAEIAAGVTPVSTKTGTTTLRYGVSF